MSVRQDERTVTGYVRSEVVSALQKAIRRGQSENAVYWASELEMSGGGWYVWMWLLVICSEDVGAPWPEGPAVIAALFNAWKSAKGREGESRLFMTDAVVRLCRAPKSRIADHLSFLAWERHDRMHRDIPDEALDMHTTRGRQMGRGVDHFFDEAAKVVPAATDPDAERLEAQVRRLQRAALGGPASATNCRSEPWSPRNSR